MKQTLQHKLSQHLVMTPQLQQSIRLLQLATPELLQEIQILLEQNPFLEQQEPFGEVENINLDEQVENELDCYDIITNTSTLSDSPLDTSFDNLYPSEPPYLSSPIATSTKDNDEQSSYYQGKNYDSLHDHLLWQANLAHFDDLQMRIALSIIDAINDHGYLTVSLNDIAYGLRPHQVSKDALNYVLKTIWAFDPVGIGARNIQECLLIQLQQYRSSPYYQAAHLLLTKYFNQLTQHEYRQLTKVTHLNKDILQQTINLIKKLTPYPGNTFSITTTDHIIPDIIVYKHQHEWQAYFNEHSQPKLMINQNYIKLCQNKTDPETQQFMRQHVNDANWFIRSIQNRNNTIMSISHYLVAYQQAFFEKGFSALKPLTLNEVAQQTGFHESTISRATTAKYLQCSHGVYELKSLFSSQLMTQEGDVVSSAEIKNRIKSLITQESSNQPLSDNKLTQLLHKEGYLLARRTVTKYREVLGILPSRQRRSLL